MSLESFKLIFLSFVTTVSLVLTGIFAFEKNKEPEAEKIPDEINPAEKNTASELPKPRQSYAS